MLKKEFTQAQIDALALEIIKEFAKDGEVTTLEEAQEMAKMELNEKANRRYEKADTPRKKAERKKKEDPVKREIITFLMNILPHLTFIDSHQEGDEDIATFYDAENITILNPEKEITFTLKDENYSITLTKHRPKK